MIGRALALRPYGEIFRNKWHEDSKSLSSASEKKMTLVTHTESDAGLECTRWVNEAKGYRGKLS